MLASEYGWSLDDILEHVYLDQLAHLVPIIERRKLDEHRIMLALITNPHTKDPKALWRMLEPPRDPLSEKLDKTSFNILKSRLSQDSSIIVK